MPKQKTTQRVNLTTLQKKAYRYLQQARKERDVSNCEKITLDEATTVLNAQQMAIVATAIPTIGSPEDKTFKVFSSLVEIPGDHTLDLAVNFFKQELEKESPELTNGEELLKPLADRFEKYWELWESGNVEVEFNAEELQEIYEFAKDVNADMSHSKTLAAWTKFITKKAGPVSTKYLKENLDKAREAVTKALSNKVPPKVGDFWIKGGIGGVSPEKAFKFLKKSAGVVGKLSNYTFTADRIYTDYKNEKYASMALRIIAEGLKVTSNPMYQALGSALGLIRWSTDEYSTVAGKLFSNFENYYDKAVVVPVDSWTLDAEICNTEGDKEVANEKGDLPGEVDYHHGKKITKEEYNNERIISPLINSMLQGSEDSSAAFNLWSLEWIDYVDKGLKGESSIPPEESQKLYNYQQNVHSVPSLDFKEVEGEFKRDDRITNDLSQGWVFTEGKGWIYKFPEPGFVLRSDFKGAKSDDIINFSLRIPSRHASGVLTLSSKPEMQDLANFTLFQTGELVDYEKSTDHYHLVPFELTITSQGQTKLAAEVGDEYFDLGKTETISSHIYVANPVLGI